MKRILSIILTLMLLVSLTACGAGSKEKADICAKAFLDSATEFNFKTAFEYLENQSSYTKPFDDIESYFETKKASLSEESLEIAGMEEYGENFLKPVFLKYAQKLTYTIKSSEIKDRKFIYNVELQMIDMEKLNINFDGTEMAEVATELYTSGIITDEMTEEEKTQALAKPLMEKMASRYIEAFDASSLITKPITLVIKNQKGKYLITDESDLGELFSSASLG